MAEGDEKSPPPGAPPETDPGGGAMPGGGAGGGSSATPAPARIDAPAEYSFLAIDATTQMGGVFEEATKGQSNR